MEWDDLRYVLALARGRTLSVAARKLGVSHSTVGRRLRAIEKRLGVRLFDQKPDAFTTTASGQDLVEVAEKVEAQVLSLEGRVLGRDEQLEGKLRVSAMDLLFRRHAPDFASFITKYPGVELTVTASDDPVSLTKREADVALRLTNAPPEYLVGRRLERVDFAVYGSRRLVKKLGPKARYDDFPWLHWDERLNPRWLDGWLAKHAPKAKLAMRIDMSSVVFRDAIARGIGVHFLACFEGDADPALARIGPIHREFSRDVWLLTLPELRTTSRVRAFMAHLTSAGARGR